MDPKVFFETGQTGGKSASGNVTDTSGETAKQAGRAFKDAFNAANAAGDVDSEAATSIGNADSKVAASSGSPDPEAIATSEKLYYPAARNVGSRPRELTAKAPLDDGVLVSAEPVRYGKSLPHIQETGNFDPPDNRVDSDLTVGSKALVDGTKPQADAQRWVAEPAEFVSKKEKDAIRVAANSQVLSNESIAAETEIDTPNSYSSHAESVSQPVDSKTDTGKVLRVKGPQGLIEIALPNGPASVSEVAEFAKSQSLPSSITTQVLNGLKGSASPGSNDQMRQEDATSAARVFEVDARVDTGQSGLSANTAFSPEERAVDQIEKLANSTKFIDQLASVLSPKPEWSPSIQQAIEVDRDEVATLIKRTLFSSDGFATKSNLATHELSSQAIQIRGSVIDAIGSDEAIKLSDFDVNKLANLLEPKFVSAVSPREELPKAQPQVEEIRSAQIKGISSLWSLNGNGDLAVSRARLDLEYRFGVLPAKIGTPDRSHQIELDSSLIAAQKFAGPEPKFQSNAQRNYEILDMEGPAIDKTFTSSDALNLRNFTNRSADDASNARPLSNNPSVAPVSSESQSLLSAAPLTNSLGEQGGLNYFAANVVGYPQVSGPTNSEGFRTTQYQSGIQTSVRDVVALSERFSQVLAERLVQNVKSGNYNLRFNVHPRELGSVDIAMEVRDGRLDAQISSTNPVTRDLLSESLPRLRDALQGGGLQLSNLEVNDNARDNQKRELMSSHQDDYAGELNEKDSNLLVEDLTLDPESVNYLA